MAIMVETAFPFPWSSIASLIINSLKLAYDRLAMHAKHSTLASITATIFSLKH